MQLRNQSIEEVTISFEQKRKFFDEGETLSYSFRIQALKKLLNSIHKYKDALLAAMRADYQKPVMEGFVGDIGVVIDDLKFTISNLSAWMEDKYLSTPITLQPARSRIIYDPKGVVVIFSPWNYPFNLCITPLIGAIAAGNCVIVKPAHETPNTSLVLVQLINETFDPRHVSAVVGDGKLMGEMLLENFTFNHIFFTGSANTGKWIMQQAAKHLTPVTLELGGKCPSIVDQSARLQTAVNRIVWSKFFNAGQTCLATDYVLVHESIKDKFVSAVISKIKAFYGNDASKSNDYCRIVNEQRLQKLIHFISPEHIIYGGKYDLASRYLEPTILMINDMDLPIMNEEIFGPILPIVIWKDKAELLNIVRRNRYPLACYIFAENSEIIDFILKRVEFGGGCINDAIAHYGNSKLPFGGVMSSGMGKYHGRHSFETFSHAKPILDSVSIVDMHIWYPPYSDTKLKIVETIIG